MDYLDELANQHNHKHYSERELLQLFPVAEPLIRARARRELAVLQERRKKLYNQRDQLPLSSPKDQLAIDLIDDEINDTSVKIKKLAFRVNPPAIPLNGITQIDLAKAKSYPLVDLYGQETRHSANRLYGKCPWHEDRVASFVIYEDQNSFYCFSCGKGGDSINYIMFDQDVDFIGAVKHLIK